MSSFDTDGYNDGFAGLQASPPDPYSFNGHTTNVYAAEYLRGWVAGRTAKREHDEQERLFRAKGGHLNPV
jgi:hypothetical protein